MLKNILIFLFCSTLFANPEHNIIIIDDFVSDEISSTLIKYQDRTLDSTYNMGTNRAYINRSTPPKIQNIARMISERVLIEMEKNFGASREVFHVSHAVIHARIPGSFCPYHSDNITFVCPIHGKNPCTIRRLCSENCMGSFEPNHTPWYDFTAILYLNDDIEGGEIVMEDGPFNKIYKKKIPIKKNRLVIFPNGPEYYHEVLTVKKGIRHNLLLWYTGDPNYTHRIIN